jgi:hypothetical protein
MPTPWSIWYPDHVVHGVTEAEWLAAPATGVQVVVEWRVPGVHERPWAGVEDRICYTGVDEYTINGWAVKYGAWLSRTDYDRCWQEAAYGDDRPIS